MGADRASRRLRIPHRRAFERTRIEQLEQAASAKRKEKEEAPAPAQVHTVGFWFHSVAPAQVRGAQAGFILRSREFITEQATLPIGGTPRGAVGGVVGGVGVGVRYMERHEDSARSYIPAARVLCIRPATLHSQPSPIRINIEGRAPQKSSNPSFDRFSLSMASARLPLVHFPAPRPPPRSRAAAVVSGFWIRRVQTESFLHRRRLPP